MPRRHENRDRWQWYAEPDGKRPAWATAPTAEQPPVSAVSATPPNMRAALPGIRQGGNSGPGW